MSPVGAGRRAAPEHVVRVGDTVHLDLAGRSVAFRLAPPPDVASAARAAMAARRAGASGPADVVAPMPGAVVAVHGRSARRWRPATPIVTLEAMKMEHVVTAPIAGRVAEVRVRRPTRWPAARASRSSSPDPPASGTLNAVRDGGPMAHHQADATTLPQTRDELLALHRETRRRRNAAAHGSPEHVAAIDLIGRIEVEIARIERAMDPPLV